MGAGSKARTAYRFASLLLVVGRVVLTFFYLRGPDFWRRRYYPLRYERTLVAASQRHEVSPYLLAAVINAESDWDPAARSAVGASGLMQVMPSTARELAERKIVDGRRYPPDQLEDPAVNIEYGAAYLRYLVERYHEVETALAAYNAGLANADEWADEGGDIREQIEFPETRQFVLEVSRGKDRYEELYPDTFRGWDK